jgi:hypothetical protein
MKMDILKPGTIVQCLNPIVLQFGPKKIPVTIPAWTIGAVVYESEGAYGVAWIVGQVHQVIEVSEDSFIILRKMD